MPNFAELYDAALTKDDVALKKLLASGVSIDERGKNNTFTTVAGALVLDGHLPEAIRLVQHFGAGPEYVILALLKSEQRTLAENLAAEFGLTLDHKLLVDLSERNIYYAHSAQSAENDDLSGLQVIAHAGSITDINACRTKMMPHPILSRLIAFTQNRPSNKDILTAIINCAAHGGHLKILEHLYPKHAALFASWVVGFELVGSHWEGRFGYNSLRFVTPKLALHSLSFIENDHFRAGLVHAIKLGGRFNYDIDEVHEQAKRVHLAMQQGDIPFATAMQQDELKMRQRFDTAGVSYTRA